MTESLDPSAAVLHKQWAKLEDEQHEIAIAIADLVILHRSRNGLTQEELAQLVGASRETVNKALADFASRGWLRLEPRSVVIMDVERLSRRAR